LSSAATFGERFQLTLLTSDPALAAAADAAGIQRVGVDLERLNKAARQAGAENRISAQTVRDLRVVGGQLRSASLFVRINPLHDGTEAEIEEVLTAGAAVIMLPFFRSAAEVRRFVELIGGRARAAILVETSTALLRFWNILAVEGVDEITIGLNDLRHDFQVRSHFEVLGSPLIDVIARETHLRGLPLTIGGVGRPDDAAAPMPVELVYAQYPRLGATGAWIARSFLRPKDPGNHLAADVAALRRRLDAWENASETELETARRTLLERASVL
jgi:citrate lyase beta subunit